MQSIIFGSAGFRCISKIFSILKNTLNPPNLPTPVFSTSRDWILKFGLFNLTRPKAPGEWIWIIDGTIQMGSMKCILILGVRMDKMKERNDFTLSLGDVEPIILKTVTSSPGEMIQTALMEAHDKTGKPIAIVSDEGSDLKRGIRLYRETQSEEQKTIHLHDVVHKLDLLLKRELVKDPVWNKFLKQMNATTQQLKLTSYAHLAPPRQRHKKRMRSEVDNIVWGQRIINYLENGNPKSFELAKLSWVLNYKSSLSEFSEMSNIFDLTTKEIRQQGYCYETNTILQKAIPKNLSKRGLEFFFKIQQTIGEETKKIPLGMRLLGSSEIIESVFGKFKQIERNHAFAGLTSLVLSLPAFVGHMSIDSVKEAMEQISIQKVKAWVKENLGTTFWSQRRKALSKNYINYLKEDDLQEVYAS